MGDRFNKIVDHFKRLALGSRHASDQAEAKVRQVNGLIRQVGEAGWVADTILFGPVIHTRAYPTGAGPSDSGQVIQAALLMPDGIGVVLWDSEQYAELRDLPDGQETDAKVLFLPFDECEPAIKGLLLPEIEPLLERLCKRLP